MLFFVSSTKIENMDDERKIQELTFKQRTAGQRAAQLRSAIRNERNGMHNIKRITLLFFLYKFL